MPPLIPSTPTRLSPRLRWWSLGSALVVSVAAALLLLLPTGEPAKAKNPTVTTASNRIEARSAPTGGGTLTKWEYATVPLLTHATKQILDTWGEDGWELVQVVPNPPGPDGDRLVAYMKRPNFR